MGFVTVMSILIVAAGIGLKLANDQIEPFVPNGLPKQMKAIRAHGPGNGTHLGDVRVDQLPLPEVGPGQVLIRVRAAAINPSDVLYLQGAYSASDSEFGFPYQGGFEGSGTVVGHGGGLFGQSLLHQRVAFALQDASAYAEYAVVDQDRVLALPADLSYERGAFSFVNPLTAVGMVSTALSEGHTGIVQTAAASALGKMFLRLCRQQSIPLINVVRREEQKQLLIKHGALPEHVLVSTDKDFEEQLRKLTHDMHVTAAFDAVAGDSPGQLLELLPEHSTVYVYGVLSGKPIGNISARSLFRTDKRLAGWHLAAWLDNLYFVQKIWYTLKMRNMLSTTLATEIGTRVSFENFVEETNKYIHAATNNKRVLIVP